MTHDDLVRDLRQPPLSEESLRRIEQGLGSTLDEPLPRTTDVATRRVEREWLWLMAAAILVACAIAAAGARSGWFGDRDRVEPPSVPPPVASVALPPPAVVADPVVAVAPVPSGSASAPVPRPAFVAAPPTEEDLLARARQSLATSPASALALADEHARRYPRGALAQEREVIAIDALGRLGRKADAHTRGEKFQRDYPSSIYATKVAQMLAGD